MAYLINSVQTKVIPFRVDTVPDLRLLGSNIKTGFKCKININGKTKNFVLYMTNTGRSLSLYIKLKGKNKYLCNDTIFRSYHLNDLYNPHQWYIESYI